MLSREPLCQKGLFFICPTPVYNKIAERLGGNLEEIHQQAGSVTLMWYDIGPAVPDGQIRALELGGQSTTTIDQVALAFTAPSNLPPAKSTNRRSLRSYEHVDRSDNMRASAARTCVPSWRYAVWYTRWVIVSLHRKELPGKPDLVFISRRKVIFVHGCFWHSHKGCKSAHVPKSNLEYWGPKLERNQMRDARNIETLTVGGWQSLIVWECETADISGLQQKIEKFLGKIIRSDS